MPQNPSLSRKSYTELLGNLGSWHDFPGGEPFWAALHTATHIHSSRSRKNDAIRFIQDPSNFTNNPDYMENWPYPGSILDYTYLDEIIRRTREWDDPLLIPIKSIILDALLVLRNISSPYVSPHFLNDPLANRTRPEFFDFLLSSSPSFSLQLLAGISPQDEYEDEEYVDEDYVDEDEDVSYE